MITGKTKTEKSYRAVNLDSSSSLKEFSTNRRKYHKKYVLNERVEEEDNKATVMGRLVETFLMEPEEFDNRFYMSTCTSAPTGNMLAFVEALYKYTAEATDEEGNITKEFEEIARAAYVDSGFKLKFETVLGKFEGSDAEIYYKELREVRAKGLTVVTTEDVRVAEDIVNTLRTSVSTADVVNMVSSAKYTVYNQLQIEGYSVNNHLFKSMIDKVIIDHVEHTIQPYDLKCTWNVENFYEEYYLYRRTYIQAYLYWRACENLTMSDELCGYHVLFPKFIVCDSTNYYNPLIYTLHLNDMEDAYNGFEHKGRTYPGVKEIIDDLNWAYQNNIWNISRKNHSNNGIVSLK